MAEGFADEARLVAFFARNNRKADTAKVRRLAAFYIEEARA